MDVYRDCWWIALIGVTTIAIITWGCFTLLSAFVSLAKADQENPPLKNSSDINRTNPAACLK